MSGLNALPGSAVDALLAFLAPVSPGISLSDLRVLQSSPALLRAIHELSRRGGEKQHLQESLLAEQKVTNLRTSLSHLTAHLTTLSNRLAASESTLSSLRLSQRKELVRLDEERDGLRALCGVWEGRWREERRAKEDLGVLGRTGGKVLNDHTTRLETSMIALRPVILPTASHSRHSSSASSSSSSSEVTRRTTSQAQRRKPEPVATSTPRLRTRQVVADLSRELERVRREADRLLFERDEEIARLQADQALRRKEMAELFSSFDTLLGIGRPVDVLPPENVSLPPDDDLLGSELRFEHRDGAPSKRRAQQQSMSVLDVPHVKATAAQSSSGRTAQLEAEVRALEQEVERMARRAGRRPREPSSSSDDEPSDVEGRQYRQRGSLASTIQDLNSQVARLRNDLNKVTNERAAFERLYKGRLASTAPDPENSSTSIDFHALLAHLEADRDRLSQLLHSSESQVEDLSTQLTSTQTHFEHISDRVRLKLVEQKEKISACYTRIGELEEELLEVEGRWEEERGRNRVLEGLLGWESGKGSRMNGEILGSGEEREDGREAGKEEIARSEE